MPKKPIRKGRMLLVMAALTIVPAGLYYGYILELQTWEVGLLDKLPSVGTAHESAHRNVCVGLGSSELTPADHQRIAQELAEVGIDQAIPLLYSIYLSRVLADKPTHWIDRLNQLADSPVDRLVLALNQWRLHRYSRERTNEVDRLARMDWAELADKQRVVLDSLWDAHGEELIVDAFLVNEALAAHAAVDRAEP